ncbi:hypothetical protein [Succinivibrio dextrinosolvens]|jgi:hypothetical protein|uniref:hypothetical protein n=1 Tax=Succinivibrio dextrinosolvens TaxID=83771 RepID=UPI00241C5BCA|nr:hypothetical protein [Succinivibrio dextrinosolvens]MBE6423056.1 hypothetical protein [Succinivibrio dextrinosolvens]
MDLKFAKDFQNGVLKKYAALGDDERILADEIVKILNDNDVYIFGMGDELDTSDVYPELYTWTTVCFFTTSHRHYKLSFRSHAYSLDDFQFKFKDKVLQFFKNKTDITADERICINKVIDEVIKF